MKFLSTIYSKSPDVVALTTGSLNYCVVHFHVSPNARYSKFKNSFTGKTLWSLSILHGTPSSGKSIVSPWKLSTFVCTFAFMQIEVQRKKNVKSPQRKTLRFWSRDGTMHVNGFEMCASVSQFSAVMQLPLATGTQLHLTVSMDFITSLFSEFAVEWIYLAQLYDSKGNKMRNRKLNFAFSKSYLM